MWRQPRISGTHIWESRWFESMYTQQGKTRLTHHTLSTFGPRMTLDHTYLMWSTYSNLLWIHQQICTDPLPPRRRAPNTMHNSTSIWSAGPYLASLPQQPMGQWEKTSFYWQPGNKLIRPISPHVIGTFNTCSCGLTHQSLTDTGVGYSLRGVDFSHITPWPSQPTVSPFQLWGPLDLQFI
jgi:hypothetical protein